MDTKELKAQIKELANEEGKNEIEIISDLQTAAAITENNELLDALCEIKWDYIG